MKLPYGTGVTLGSLLALALLALLVGATVQVRTGMEDFVVDTSKSERLGVLGKLLSSRRARTMAFVVGADDPAVHRQAAADLRRRLGESGLFAWVRGGSETGDVEAFYALFFPPRFGLLEVPGAGELPAWVKARVLAAREALGGARGALVGRLITRDPLLAFPELLRRLQEGGGEGGGGVRDNAGQLETKDGKWSVVFAQANAPALEGPKQKPVVELVERVTAELSAKGAVKVMWTGVNRFAVETERRIRGELGWIAVLSTVPVFLLYLLVFRSLRQFFAGLIIIGIAIAVAVLACQGIFGAVHGLALTFGASLIGVTIDYAAHYSVHLAASPREERQATLRMLLRATTTGVVTTVAAFAAVAGGRVPVLQQIALLGVTGAVVAFVLTHLLLPRFIPPPVAVPAPAGPRRVDVLLSGLDRHKRAVMITTGVILLVATAGLLRWRWQDDVAAFKTPLPALEAETETVQRLLGQDGQAPTVVVTGADDEQALALHEQVVARLATLTSPAGATGARAGAIDGFASVQSVLVSAGTQRARRQRLGGELEQPYRAALAEAGFQPAAFPPWQQLLADGGPPLEPAQIAASPVAFLLDSWRIELDANKVGYLITLKGVRNEAGVAAALEAFPGVFLIRPAGLLEETYALFRDRILRWLGVGTALVILIMIVVYRNATFVLAGVLPAALGAAATLGLLALLGIPGNVLHVVGLVLVLGLGVDYGVYLVEAREGSIGLSIRGILLGAATTCISFGALAFSGNAAVHTLGLTSAIGIVFTTITCPLVIFLVQGKARAA